MCSNRRIHFAYFLVFSLLMHMILLAVPLSLKVDNKKEIMEVFYFSLGGEHVAQGGNSVEQNQGVQLKPGTISHEQRTTNLPSSPDVSNDLRERKRRNTPMVGAAATAPHNTKEGITDDRTVVAGEEKQPLSIVAHNTTQAIEGALSDNRSEVDRLNTAVSGAGDGMSATGAEGSAGPLYAAFGATDGPRFLHRELPEYPFVSKKRGEEGTAVLTLLIDGRGRLLSAEVVSATNAAFAEAALRAMKKSTFKPAEKNGKPVTSKAILPVRFTLDQ
jgi:TonB family protein